jgi:D-ribose pyranase
VIARLGHTDRLVVCDAGLPIPRDAEVVDLALTRNVPRFLEAVQVILEEMEVESAVVATEMETISPETRAELIKLLPGIPVTAVPHEEFKRLTRENGGATFVRTGEATPYANVVLVSGVDFD